jgi:hypothetical protein
MEQVSCGECGYPLGEKGRLPLTERGSCPQCGGTARAFSIQPATEKGTAMPLGVAKRVSITPAQEKDTAVTLRIHDAHHVQVAGEPTIEEIEKVATVSERVRRVLWMEPTDINGSYTAMVYDENDELIAAAEKPTADEALAAILLALMPEADDGVPST